MSPDTIIVDVGPGETRAAFLEGGRLVRFEISRAADVGRVGDVYLGRIAAVTPSLDAAFVELGLERPGLLAAADRTAPADADDRRRRRPAEGDGVLVQITREAVGDKGVKLTARPALAGRALVLKPFDRGVGVSQRLAGPGSEAAIAAIASALDGTGHGWVIRRAALALAPADVAAEAADLARRWAAIAARAADGRPPVRLEPGPDPVTAAVVDEASAETRRIVVNDGGAAARLRAAVPDLARRIVATTDRGSPFAAAGIDDEIAALAAPVVALPSGGRVIITETPALVAIDVDSGATAAPTPGRAARTANLEAAAAIARQVRLRDLAGLIVVDFLPMRRRQHRDEVVAVLRRGLAGDDRDLDVVAVGRSGTVEVTRRRPRPSLTQRLTAACPCCDGSGRVRAPSTVALEALRAVLDEDRVTPGRHWRIEAAPAVIAVLDGSPPLAEAAARLGRPPTLVIEPALAPDRFRVVAETAGPSR